MSESPYKFLDSYDGDDRDRFFGRDLETDILLADVVVSRLVVLFAKTGTGKTSLINAGVRPRLEDRGYATFFIRSREDPLQSARATLRADAPGRFPRKGTFSEQLRGLVRRLKRPVVLFFDQFEEFFLYVVARDIARAEEFVSAIADVYEDRESGVHVVFSMREEWFVDMGLFRDRIPAIFHNDANLRLRWFDRAQARAAIVGPAGEGVYEPRLVDRLIAELVETGREVAGIPSPGDVEPAQLQIVCDTLWRTRRNGRLTLAAYRKLGDPDSDNVARVLLDRRLVAEFEDFETRDELQLLQRLLPELQTPEGTKRVRDRADLVASLLSTPGLTAVPTLIDGVLAKLGAARLLEIVPRESGELVELTHDYLVLRLNDLQHAIGLIWPRRVIADGVRAWREGRTLLTADVLPDVLERVDELRLDAESGELLLRSALGHLVAVEPIMAALQRSGTPVWDVFSERIADGAEAERVRAIETLSALDQAPAARILRRTLDIADAAPHVVRQAGRVPSAASLRILEEGLRRPELVAEVRPALSELAERPLTDELARRATKLLRRSLAGRNRRQAADALVALDSRVAVALLDELAGTDPPAPEARDGLVRLARSTHASVRARARAALFQRVERALGDGRAEPWCVDAIEGVEDTATPALLGRLAQHAPLRPRADEALQALKEWGAPEVAAVAARELDRLAGVARPQPPPPKRAAAQPRTRLPELEAHYPAALQLLGNGRLVPFLGAGVAAADRVPGETWESGRGVPTGGELARMLADAVAYPDAGELDLPRVAQYAEARVGRGGLYAELRRYVGAPAPPARLHVTLASLGRRFRAGGRPALPAIVTTAYDDRLERAFHDHGEPFDLLTYNATGEHAGRFTHTMPSGERTPITQPARYSLLAPGERTVILKLYGGVERQAAHDSYVVTEDDYVDYAIRAADSAFLPKVLAAVMYDGDVLFLGHGLRDWNLRAMLRVLWEGDRTRVRRSWAVTRDPSEVEISLWQRRDVHLLDVSVAEYVEGLERHLTDFDIGAVPA